MDNREEGGGRGPEDDAESRPARAGIASVPPRGGERGRKRREGDYEALEVVARRRVTSSIAIGCTGHSAAARLGGRGPPVTIIARAPGAS